MKEQILPLIPQKCKSIREYTEQLYTNKLDNLLETYNLPRLNHTHTKIKNLSRPKTNNFFCLFLETESVIKTHWKTTKTIRVTSSLHSLRDQIAMETHGWRFFSAEFRHFDSYPLIHSFSVPLPIQMESRQVSFFGFRGFNYLPNIWRRINTNPSQNLQKTEEGTHPNSFSEASITLIPAQVTYYKKRKLHANIPDKYRYKYP